MDKKADFMRSRKGAVVALVCACVVSSSFITSNLSAVEVSDGNQKKTVISAKSANAAEIINRAGFELNGADSYKVENENGTGNITILRAFDITVIDGGETKTVSAVEGTVEEALTYANIDLPSKDDIINVALTDAAEEGMTVKIDRVEYVTTTTTKTVAYKTVKKNDNTLASGKTKVSVEGINGTKEVTTVKKLVNGKVVDTKTTEKVTKKPVDRIVLNGTKGSSTVGGGKYTVNTAGKTLTINGKTVSYKKVLTGSGTAYTAPKGAKTSTGKVARVGLVAVNPKIIPYGTKLYIASTDGKVVYGYAEAADTGGALRNGSALVDLFYNTEAECIKFGRRQVNVYILS